jgi:hypothetical protein
MSNHKRRLLARLATGRADLLWQVLGLDEATLTTVRLDAWTCKDILAHGAAWESFAAARVASILDSKAGELVGVDDAGQNPVFYAQCKDWPLCRVLAELSKSRASLIFRLRSATQRDLDREYQAAWGPVRASRYADIVAEHDGTHAAQIRAWREAHPAIRKRVPGPGCILVTSLDAAREEFLAWSALISPAERAALPVCGTWTVQDTLGHLADWELFGANGLERMLAGEKAGTEYGGNLEEWNQSHQAARRGQTWRQARADAGKIHARLLDVVQGLDDATLARKAASAWDPDDSAYNFALTFADHDREHTAGVREQVTGGA